MLQCNIGQGCNVLPTIATALWGPAVANHRNSGADQHHEL